MDLIVTCFRKAPFVDNKTYATMCFGCAYVPTQYVQTYTETGEIQEEFGPFFDHKHLETPRSLLQQGTVETLAEGKRCVAGVKKKIKEAGIRKLNKLKLKRPKMELK